jgi:hypothetical protein
MTRQAKLDERRDALTKSHDVWEHEKYLYNQAIDYATDDPEPQADNVETIAHLIATECQAWSDKYAETLPDFASKEAAIAWYRASHTIEIEAWSKIIQARLSAPVDVQARAEAVVRDFCFGTKRLYEDERKELSRLIVEQFTRKG